MQVTVRAETSRQQARLSVLSGHMSNTPAAVLQQQRPCSLSGNGRAAQVAAQGSRCWLFISKAAARLGLMLAREGVHPVHGGQAGLRLDAPPQMQACK